MKYLYTFFISLFVIFNVTSQEVDHAKMDKDLEIAENILATLMKQSGNEQFVLVGRERDVEGKYLPDYGVVISVSSLGFKVLHGKVWTDGKTAYSWGQSKEKDDEELTPDSESHQLEDVFRDFLVDYGSMIRQLKPQNKIMVKTESKRGGDATYLLDMGKNKKMTSGGISAEVLKSDLQAHEDGKLTREELMEKIKITENIIDYSKEPQLEVFSSMLERLYEVDLAETYYMARTPSYERMENFGVTYYLKYYSSTVHDEDDYSLPTVGRKHVSKDERNKIVEEMYPDFVKDFKKNILEYGHILKNVEADEMLVFNIKLTSCEGCDMPAAIEVSTRKSIIDDYRKEAISLEKAMEQITVKTID